MSVYVALPTELQTSVFVAGRGIEPLSVPYDGLLLMKLLYNFLNGNRALFNRATTTPTRNLILKGW